MLQYTTTNIVNTLGTYGAYKKNGTAADGTEAEVKFRLNWGPEFKKDAKHRVTSVYVNKASKPEFAKATIDLSGIGTAATDVYQVVVYVRLQGDNSSEYANDWVFKGKPFNLGEFNGAKAAAAIASGKVASNAEYVASIVKKFCTVQFGKDLLKVTADGDDLVIEAKTQFQRFIDQDANTSVQLMKLTANTDGNVHVVPEKWVAVDGVVTLEVAGKEAFGDYTHMIRDYRLPSDENLRWLGIAQGDVFGGEPNDDYPRQGQYYSQITVEYEADRGLGNATVLGGQGTSRTTHVFFVADTPADGVDTGAATPVAVGSVAEDFLAELTKALPTGVAPIYAETKTSVQ